MRNIIKLLVAFMAVACSTKHEDVVLTFKVDDPRQHEVVLVCHNDVKFFTLDSLGQAEAVLTDVDAAYMKLFYGRESKWIYVERGDRAEVSFNGNDFLGSFSFGGEKAKAVEYLNRVKLVALPDEDFALEFDEYAAKLAAKEADALRLLKANELGSAGEFEYMEKGRIRYSYGASLMMYPVGHRFVAGDMSYEPGQDYLEAVASYFVEDEKLVDLDEYRDLVLELAHSLDLANRGVRDIYSKTVAQMKYIVDRFENEKVRKTLLHSLAATYVERHGIDDVQELENLYFTYVKDESLIADYARKCEKWDVSKPGKPSPEFEAPDVDGKMWTVADFKGKYVYIDLWATWCTPCRREFPYLKALEEEFKDAEIVFVGLCTDNDKGKWEVMVKGGSLSGIQLYLGPQSKFQKAYNVAGIPRFILLDKEGRIISNDMSRPSSEETAKTLRTLEGIRM